MVLDEPNSNLDANGERALAKALIRAKEKQMTVVTITQRAALLRSVDQDHDPQQWRGSGVRHARRDHPAHFRTQAERRGWAADAEFLMRIETGETKFEFNRIIEVLWCQAKSSLRKDR